MDIDDDDAIDGNHEQDDFAHLDAAPEPVVAHDDEDDSSHDASSASDDTDEEEDNSSQSEHEDAAWRTVTVKSGDSLSAIAKRELGSANRWREIFDANRDKLSNPDLIHPGQVLKLPH